LKRPPSGGRFYWRVWTGLTPLKAAPPTRRGRAFFFDADKGKRATESVVAADSIRAMVLRTIVWLLLFLGLAWLGRRSRRSDGG